MAQFDSLIIFPLIFGLFFTLIFYYNMCLTLTIPNFFGVKKFWKKKLSLIFFYKFFYDNQNINKINSYKNLFLLLK